MKHFQKNTATRSKSGYYPDLRLLSVVNLRDDNGSPEQASVVKRTVSLNQGCSMPKRDERANVKLLPAIT